LIRENELRIRTQHGQITLGSIAVFSVFSSDGLCYAPEFLAHKFNYKSYSPFCVQAKIIKLVGLKNSGLISPINLVTFAGTQNGE
jgi:hypothetical protein